MANYPARGNNTALPEIADIHTRALHVSETFEMIERASCEEWPGFPIISICAAFKKMAESVVEDLESLTALERQR